jgi:glucokinase
MRDVAMRADGGYLLGLDLGGTRLKAVALSAAGEVILRRGEESGGDGWQERVRGVVAEIHERLGLPQATGVAAPGLPAADGRGISFMPGRLPGLEGLDWTDFLQSGRPVPVLNDAHAALLGEAWLGAAAGMEDVILLTLGTGVGGAILSGGRLVQGHIGRAGHFGHLSLDSRGRPDLIGMPGSLEDAVGDHTVVARSGGKFRSTAELVAAAGMGDARAAALWADTVRDLAVGISTLINVLDPEAVVIGGGIAEAGEALFEPLACALAEVEWRPGGQRVRILPARLGSWAGAFGAAFRALRGTNLSSSS